jgi:hypothetical protein
MVFASEIRLGLLAGAAPGNSNWAHAEGIKTENDRARAADRSMGGGEVGLPESSGSLKIILKNGATRNWSPRR